MSLTAVRMTKSFMFVLFSVFAFSARSESKYNECFKRPTSLKKLECFAEKLKPIDNEVRTPFMGCFVSCSKLENEADRTKCMSSCNEMTNPSENSQDCLLQCGKEEDPVHHLQCMDSCRLTNRIDAVMDVKDGCKRCRVFAQFLKEVAKKVTEDDELEKSLSAVCGNKLSLLPMCQAITKMGFETLKDMIEGGATYDQICEKLGLCERL